MVLPQSGNPISLLNLQTEYDDTAPTSLSEFYGQANAPASGTIDMADFYASAGGNPVTSNLLFELDTRNSSSWSGSGGTWYDTTSNNRDFSLQNGPANTTAGGITCIDFDGSNDYAQISDGTWIPDGYNAWTCEAYVYIDDFAYGSFYGNERLIFSKTSPSNQGMSLGFKEQSNGDVHMIAGTQGGGNVSGSTHYYNMGAASNYEGTWTHVVWVYDGNNLTYYLNGSQVATWSGRVFHANTAPLRFMCLDPGNSAYTFPVNGKLAVVRMYSTALIAQQITTNRANCTGGSTATNPTATITPANHQGIGFTATIQFDERVANFTDSDVSVSGGYKSPTNTFTKVDKDTYTVGLASSITSGTITVTIPANACINATNLGNNAVSHSIPYIVYQLATTNLYINCDATNSSSYNGSGTTWSSLSSLAAQDLRISGSPTFSSSAQPKHFDLDASNDYFYVTSTIPNGADTRSFTEEVWFKTSTADGRPLMQLNNRSSGTNINSYDRHIYVGQNGYLYFGIWAGNNGGVQTINNGSSVTDNTWRQVLCTYDNSAGTSKMYINGSLVASGSMNPTQDTGTRYLNVGSGRLQSWPQGQYGSGRRYSNADIAVANFYWGTALSATDVTAHWNVYKSTFGL